jgi:hypothetical protein
MDSDTSLRALALRRLLAGGWSPDTAGAADAELIIAAFALGLSRSPKRGALLSGAFGCGKTLACSALYRAEGMDARNRTYSCRFLACFEADTWGYFEHDASYCHRLGWIVLDDLGADLSPEPGRRDIVGDLIMRLHKHWARGLGSGLAVTTNLTGAQLAARYGGRVMSRLMEMVVPVALTGSDHRSRVSLR